MDGMKIAELMERLDQTIRNNFYSPIWIIAEIQSINFREKAIYIDLADFDEKRNKSHTLTVRAMIWMNNYQSLIRKHGKKAVEEVLVENIQGRFLAQVSFYKGNATVSLQLLDLDTKFTKGLLALEREKLLKELSEKGLDVKNKSLKMPSFPLRVGLITAEGSRAMSDFLDQLHSYKFPGEVIFYPAHMQGESTLKEVAEGLRKLSQMNLDAIVLTRGGGSAADLRWFDSPEIAYALAEAKMPVISAIGHHDDVCVAELISYHREKLPQLLQIF